MWEKQKSKREIGRPNGWLKGNGRIDNLTRHLSLGLIHEWVCGAFV